MPAYFRILSLLFLAVLFTGRPQYAYADSTCNSYTLYSTEYFNCLVNGVTPSFRNNCEPTTDSRFPNNSEIIKLPSHDIVYNNDTARYIGLIKDGASLTCPTDADGNPTERWDDANKGKIVVKYSPCTGTLTNNNTFLDGIDCSPIGKSSSKLDDLDNTGTRSSAITMALENGECQTAYGVKFCAELQRPLICAYVPKGASKMYIGCHDTTITGDTVPTPALACFIPNLCWDKNALSGVSKNQVNFSLSGAVAMCAEGAIDKIFFSSWDSNANARLATYGSFGQSGAMGNTEAYSCPTVSMFQTVQQSLRTAALAAITLWVVLWGVRVTISGTPPSRGEFIKNVVVVAIVMYFSIGNGWTDYLPIIKTLMSGLSQAMMTAVTSNDPGANCVFNADSYPNGFENMALWDTFDCKIMSYFFSNSTGVKLLEVAFMSVFTVGIYGVLCLLLALVFALFLIGLLIHTIEIYVVSLIIIAFLAFISPIFIPMVLFNATKGYFKAWLGELISVSLYPIILFGFIALMLSVFDRFYYGDCQGFNNTCTTVNFMGVQSTVPVSTSMATDSVGYQTYISEVNWDDWKVTGLSADIFLLGLIRICFFAFLFFRFMAILGPFVSELVGSARTDISNITGSPADSISKVMEMGQKGLDTAVGAAKSGDDKKGGEDKGGKGGDEGGEKGKGDSTKD